MIYSIKNHIYPKSIDEVLTLLQKSNSAILAGGSAITLGSSSTLETLIDLQELNLSYILDKEDHYIIGAMTSAYDIFAHPDLPQSLRTAAEKIGDNSLLHSVTIGGNLAILYPWVDLPPMLWALNASIILFDLTKRTLTANEFFEYSKERNAGTRGALITEIKIPKTPKNSYSEFQTLTLIENEKCQLSLASYFEWKDGLITKVRLVVSGATKTPLRLPIEKLIKGKQLNDELINECKISAGVDIEIVPNYKSSKEYRKEILGVYVKRTLHNCLNKMREEKQ